MLTLNFPKNFLISIRKNNNLDIIKRLHAIKKKKGNTNSDFITFKDNNIKEFLFPIFNKKFYSSDQLNQEMTTVVPQAVAIDPTNIPVDYHTPIHDIVIELKDFNENCNPDKGLIAFVGSNVNKENNIIKINATTTDHNINEFLKQDNIGKLNGKSDISPVFSVVNDNKEFVNLTFINCGTGNEVTEADIRRLGATLATILCDHKFPKLTLVCELKLDKFLFRGILENFFYEYTTDVRFKRADKSINVEYIKHLTVHIHNANAFRDDVEKARIYYSGVNYACQLIAAPSNYCNPVSLANSAIELAKKLNLQCKILGVKEIEELKMGAYLSVGKGSMYPHRFIHLTYKGKGEIKKKIALVGKGITFDSGGYNLKTSPNSMIDLMKFDMSGCAALLGCAYCIGTIKPDNVEIHFISAVCENMISQTSYRPGDVITAANGKTIEVGNTDAEGRLTLADALIYAEKLNVNCIIDIATLTSAILYSLGTSCAGLFTNNDQLANKLLNCSKTANEPLWRLPLVTEYRSSLNSKLADINNCSNCRAGAIIAALFLKDFVHNTPWAHIDIAGTSWNFKVKKPRGFGVRLLTEFILNEVA